MHKIYTLQYKNPPKYGQYKYGAKSRNLKFKLTQNDFNKISNSNCFFCGISGPNGIDRKNNNIGYIKSNCIPCCKHCNYSKGGLEINEFIIWLKRFKYKKL